MQRPLTSRPLSGAGPRRRPAPAAAALGRALGPHLRPLDVQAGGAAHQAALLPAARRQGRDTGPGVRRRPPEGEEDVGRIGRAARGGLQVMVSLWTVFCMRIGVFGRWLRQVPL